MRLLCILGGLLLGNYSLKVGTFKSVCQRTKIMQQTTTFKLNVKIIRVIPKLIVVDLAKLISRHSTQTGR